MTNFHDFIHKYYELSKDIQEKLLFEIYHYSKDIKLFMDSKVKLPADTDRLVKEMEKETIGKVYKKGIPGTPNGRKVNTIIIKAKKANVFIEVLMQLEKLAYRGFIEFLNEYGGGPENFDELSEKHLEAYLKLVKAHMNKGEQNQIFEEIKNYLINKDNMFADNLDIIFEDITGIPINK